MRYTHYYLAILCMPLIIACSNPNPHPADRSHPSKNKLQRINGAIAFEFLKTVDPNSGIVPTRELYQTWQTIKNEKKSLARRLCRYSIEINLSHWVPFEPVRHSRKIKAIDI